MPLQTHGIQPVQSGAGYARCQHVWRNILRHSSHATHKGIVSNPHKLVDSYKGTHGGTISHPDMAAKGGSIGKDHTSPGEAIMRNVRIGHQKILFPDVSDSAAELRPPVNCHEFSDCSSPTNLHNCLLSLKFQGLRNSTYGCVLKYLTIGPKCRVLIYCYMRANYGSSIYLNVSGYYRIGSDFHARIYLCRGINDSSRMYHGFSPVTAITSASATRDPSTVALPDILKTFPRLLVHIISRMSWSPGTTGFLKRALSMPIK